MGALYTVGSRLFEAGFRAMDIDLRSSGHRNIPDHGPAVLASNHIGYLDFSFVMLAPPRPRREVRFLARREFFELPVVGAALRELGQIPVDVHGDARAAADVASSALERGELVGVHPEGTISPSFVPRRGKSGAVRLADRVQAPIVPVAVWGSHRLLTKGRQPRPPRGVVVMVRYGEPFRPSARTGMARTSEVMERITALLDQLQRAYPQRPGPPPDDWWLPAHLGGSAPTPEEAEAVIARQDAERRERRRAELGS
ncbi:MAG: lysophospholipid acyltransferase family protein [Nitriliruptoraceae bacterium]